MTTFDDRERAFEAKWVHDADTRFKVEARRNRARTPARARAGSQHGATGARDRGPSIVRTRSRRREPADERPVGRRVL